MISFGSCSGLVECMSALTGRHPSCWLSISNDLGHEFCTLFWLPVSWAVKRPQWLRMGDSLLVFTEASVFFFFFPVFCGLFIALEDIYVLHHFRFSCICHQGKRDGDVSRSVQISAGWIARTTAASAGRALIFCITWGQRPLTPVFPWLFLSAKLLNWDSEHGQH